MGAGRRSGTLILGCEQRSALACVRSIGARGGELVLGARSGFAPGFHSRWATRYPRFTYSDPFTDLEGFVRDIEHCTRNHGIGTIFPISDDTLLPLLTYALPEKEDIQIPIPSREVLKDFSDKRKVLAIAAQHGIAVPGTWDVNTGAVLGDKGLLAVKPHHSVEIRAGRMRKRKVRLIDAAQATNLDQALQPEYFLQEYIPGHGVGIYFLFWNGDYVMHMLARTEAQQVGPGSVTRAVVMPSGFEPEVEKLKDLLREKKWHGVIMFEFRLCARTGKLFLIETNPRFWGPTQLAVDAGYDFPWALYSLCNGAAIDPDAMITNPGMGYTWKIGAWRSAFARVLKGRRDIIEPAQHNASRGPASAKTYRDIHLRLDDPLPAGFEFLAALKRLWR